MYEYFHCLILLNGHYTSNNVELGVFNVQLVSKTSEEGPVQKNFTGDTWESRDFWKLLTEERNGRCSRTVSFEG